jgi:hypothetical protein
MHPRYHPILADLEALVDRLALPRLEPDEDLNDRLITDRGADLDPLRAELAALHRRALAVRDQRYLEVLGPGGLAPDECDPRFDADDAVRYAVGANAFLCSPRDPSGNIGPSRPGAHLLRDLAGNPFCPAVFDPRWRSESAVALSRTAYDTRNFSLLPVLADALEEVGCDNDGILNHSRVEGPHVRGCWVVDAVLDRC